MLDMDTWRSRFNGDRWKAFLEEGLNPDREYDEIRRATRTGYPIGSDAFIKRLELLTGRVLQHKKPGPKPVEGEEKRS